MAKTKISEFSSTPGNNTDIDSINLAEGCAPSGINDAIRELMAQLKDFQTGAVGDSFNGPVGTTTAAAGAFTTLTTSSTVTHNGGTANGVAYLNGSKVLTTGSALTYNGTGLGVGVSSAAFALDVGGADGTNIALSSTGTSSARFRAYVNSAESGVIGFLNGGGQFFEVAGTEGMRLTSTGLGIGTSSPAAKLDVVGNFRAAGVVDSIYTGTTAGSVLGSFRAYGTGSGVTGETLIRGILNTGSTTSSYLEFGTTSSGTLAEKMRLDSGGSLLVGTTSDLGGLGGKVQIASAGSRGIVQSVNANVRLQEYLVSGSTVGFISTDGTNTTYSTSSDYRLKENIAPMTGALAKVAALKPVTYTWKTDGSAGEGFIAHELAEVCPAAVTGAKDAVDADGRPQYQGIDVSFLVGTLTAAIQEQQAIIEQLKARLDAANL